MILIAITLLIGFASFRIWRFLAEDTITASARAYVFFHEDECRFPVTYYFWTCPWCLGTWITAAVTLVTDLVVDGGIPMPLLVFGAAAAVTGILGETFSDQGFDSSV